MKKLIATISILLISGLAYAAPPTPPATPLPSFSDGYLKSDSGTLSWATPAGAGDVVGPATSTQYKIPLWGASDKTLVDGVAVGTEGMLLRSAGAGANPAWSAYTLALPGDVGAVLYSDGTNWTRSASPAIPSMNLYGAASQLALGSNSSSTAPADASVVFRNATTDYYIILQSGATADENQTYTLPTALPTASGQVLSATDAGVMSWIDAGSGSGDFKADGTVPMTAGIQFEGATANDYETTLTVTDPTADNTVTLADASGTVTIHDEIVKDGTDPDTITASQMHGQTINNYGQADDLTLTLAAAAEGLTFNVILGTTVAKYFRLDPDAGDKIYLDGTADADGHYVGIASAVAGAAISCKAFQTGAAAYDWYCSAISGSWTME